MRDKIVPVLALLAAAGIQANLPSNLYVFGVGPNLVLVVLIVFSLSADVSMGLFLGFAAGLIEGAVVGSSLGSFIVTRTIIGFAAGMSTSTFFSVNPLVAVLSAFWLTLACEVMFVLANPVSSLWDAAKIVGVECAWNALLSLVLVYVVQYFRTSRKIRLANERVLY